MNVIKPGLFNSSGNDRFIINNSAAFARESSQYLTRNFPSQGNRKTWTMSGWFKLSDTDIVSSPIFSSYANAPHHQRVAFENNSLYYLEWDGSASYGSTDALFRDVSEWYHVIFIFDTTVLTVSDIIKIYVNGRLQQYNPNVNFALNEDGAVNIAGTHAVGRFFDYGSVVRHFNGYAAEFHFIDGQALTANDFGEMDAISGQWNPIEYTGTHGINGFHLDFKNAIDLGEDSSGNANHFTNNGVTQSSDTPTNNHTTWNSLIPHTVNSINKSALTVSGPNEHFYATIEIPQTGKYYVESLISKFYAGIHGGYFGVGNSVADMSGYYPATAGSTQPNGVYQQGSNILLERIGVVGDVISLSIDADLASIDIRINNIVKASVSYNKEKSKLLVYTNGGSVADACIHNLQASRESQTYLAPSGYSSLSSENLAEPIVVKSGEHFKPYAYKGTGSGIQVGDNVQDIDLYPLSNSGAFASEENVYLSKVFQTPTDQNKWTLSTWIKKTNVDVIFSLFSRFIDVSNFGRIYLKNSTNILTYQVFVLGSGGNTINVNIEDIFNDVTFWYNIVINYDSGNVDPSKRFLVEVNGVSRNIIITTAIGLNENGYLNAPAGHFIGQLGNGTNHYDGLMAETHFIDGQIITASDFGQKDGNDFWVPKQYTGTYGTNGFHLDFTDGLDQGKDISGNLNHFTNSGVIQSIDNPSNSYLLMSDELSNASINVSKSGTRISQLASSAQLRALSNLLPNKGKWYWEVTVTNLYFNMSCGVQLSTEDNAGYNLEEWIYNSIGSSRHANINTAYGDTYVTGDVIGLALDIDSGKIWFSKNGVFQNAGDPITGNNPAYVNIPNSLRMVDWGDGSSNNRILDYGFTEDSWTYSAPADFLALSSNNIVDDLIALNSPDLVIIKGVSSHGTPPTLHDSVRGPNKYFETSSAGTEQTDPNAVQQFNKGGFRIGSSALVNTVDRVYTSWCWNKAVTPGFDVVQYTGTGTNQLIPHNVGAPPAFMMVRNLASALSFVAYHKDGHAAPATAYSLIDTTGSGFLVDSTMWNNITPTNINFSVGSNNLSNGVGTDNMMAYLFAEVEGFSKIGKYTGNGLVDGTFVHCGFKPSFVMVRRNSGGGYYWLVLDSGRSSYNAVDLGMGLTVPDGDAIGFISADMLSNGFKLRAGFGHSNAASVEYVFIAFAEHPFKYSRAV